MQLFGDIMQPGKGCIMSPNSCIVASISRAPFITGRDKVVQPVNSGLCWVAGWVGGWLAGSRGYLKNRWADLVEILQVDGHGQ